METGQAFLITLAREIEDFDPMLFQPRHEPDADEKLLGEASELTRKFYSLAMYYGRQRDQALLDAKYDDHICDEVTAKVKELNAKHEMLLGMFWYMVRTELGLWADSNIGVRKEWKVVRTTSKPDIPPQLKALFGGIIGPPPSEE